MSYKKVEIGDWDQEKVKLMAHELLTEYVVELAGSKHWDKVPADSHAQHIVLAIMAQMMDYYVQFLADEIVENPGRPDNLESFIEIMQNATTIWTDLRNEAIKKSRKGTTH